MNLKKDKEKEAFHEKIMPFLLKICKENYEKISEFLVDINNYVSAGNSIDNLAYVLESPDESFDTINRNRIQRFSEIKTGHIYMNKLAEKKSIDIKTCEEI